MNWQKSPEVIFYVWCEKSKQYVIKWKKVVYIRMKIYLQVVQMIHTIVQLVKFVSRISGEWILVTQISIHLVVVVGLVCFFFVWKCTWVGLNVGAKNNDKRFGEKNKRKNIFGLNRKSRQLFISYRFVYVCFCDFRGHIAKT